MTASQKKRKSKHTSDLNSSKACYSRILYLASIKERNTNELYERLVNKEGYSQEAYRQAINKALKLCVVDDLRFAEFYCRSKLSRRFGTNAIRRDLEKLEIDYLNSNIIKSLLINAEKNAFTYAFELLCSHPSKAKDKYKTCFSRLVRKGYSFDIAQKATIKWLHEFDQHDSNC